MSISLSGSFSASSISKTSMPANFLEQAALAFHDRLRGQRTDVAEAEHGRAVGDDADEVGARGVEAGVGRILDDGVAGIGDARRVGERLEVALVGQALSRAHRNLSGRGVLVIFECGVAQVLFHLGLLVLSGSLGGVPAKKKR